MPMCDLSMSHKIDLNIAIGHENYGNFLTLTGFFLDTLKFLGLIDQITFKRGKSENRTINKCRHMKYLYI